MDRKARYQPTAKAVWVCICPEPDLTGDPLACRTCKRPPLWLIEQRMAAYAKRTGRRHRR